MVGLQVARSPTILSVLTVRESEVAQVVQGTGKTLLLFHVPLSPVKDLFLLPRTQIRVFN